MDDDAIARDGARGRDRHACVRARAGGASIERRERAARVGVWRARGRVVAMRGPRRVGARAWGHDWSRVGIGESRARRRARRARTARGFARAREIASSGIGFARARTLGARASGANAHDSRSREGGGGCGAARGARAFDARDAGARRDRAMARGYGCERFFSRRFRGRRARARGARDRDRASTARIRARRIARARRARVAIAPRAPFARSRRENPTIFTRARAETIHERTHRRSRVRVRARVARARADAPPRARVASRRHSFARA